MSEPIWICDGSCHPDDGKAHAGCGGCVEFEPAAAQEAMGFDERDYELCGPPSRASELDDPLAGAPLGNHDLKAEARYE